MAAVTSGPGGCGAPGRDTAITPVRIGDKDATLNAACRMLLRTGAPVPIARLAAEVGEDPADIAALVADYERLGRMRRDGDRVVAAIGVSVIPSDFEIVAGQRHMWAWCAKTGLGVVAALGLGGRVASRSPASGAPVTVEFTGQAPHPSTLVVFWPDDSFRDSCASAAEDYCPSLAIFESADAARGWAEQRNVAGEVLPVEIAANRASEHYSEVLDLTGQGSDLAAGLGGAAPG
jgi:alkylmercury lyase